MNSLKNSKQVALVQNIHFKYKVKYYNSNSLRDYFINAISFKKNKERPNEITILHDISFKIRQGDIIGILGKNGTGKTSLCRILAGIFRPDSGTVKTPKSTRAIFDTGSGVINELTGEENARILMAFMYPTLRKKEREKHLQNALEFSELNEFIKVPYKKYSKGMQARLWLSLITAMPSELLILDEVFDGIDQFFKEKVSKRMKRLIHGSCSTVLVSHKEEQIRSICNRVIVLSKGKIIYDGDVNEGIATYKKIKSENS